MCNFKCPKHKTCYRFIARPSEFRQAYFSSEPWIKQPEKSILTSSDLRKPLKPEPKNEFECCQYWPADGEHGIVKVS